VIGWNIYTCRSHNQAKFKGVPVKLYVIYPDGSCVYIGTIETVPLAGGVYGFAWTPP